MDIYGAYMVHIMKCFGVFFQIENPVKACLNSAMVWKKSLEMGIPNSHHNDDTKVALTVAYGSTCN